MKKAAIYILIVIALSGCEKQFYDLGDIQQEILFKSEYFNAAWGYQHNGILVTREGKVYRFDLPEKWNFPDDNETISSAKLMENLEQADEFLGTVEPDELIKYLNKLYQVDPDDLTEPEHQMYDAGISTFSGYIYNQRRDTYKEVLLKQTGDIYIENNSREASQIYNWLLTLL